MVRVAIDVSSAATGGGVSYLRHMLPRLGRLEGIEVGPILARVDLPKVAAALPDEAQVLSATGRLGARDKRWESAVRKSGADVVFAPTEISFGRYDVPQVLALRNPRILDRHVRRGYPLRQRAKFLVQRNLAIRSAHIAAWHIAVSDYARRAALGGLGIDPSRISVVRHGGPARVAEPRSTPVHKFLFVSTLYRAKNLHRLLRCLAQVPGAWTLDVVGDMPDRRYGMDIQRTISSMAGRVKYHGYLTGRALEQMYRQADCLVWPSYAETFGHPLLEAHAHGLALLVARACSNEEIAGAAAAYYFDPFDEPGLIEVLKKSVGAELSPGTLPRVYDWEVCVRQTGEVLAAVSQGRRPRVTETPPIRSVVGL